MNEKIPEDAPESNGIDWRAVAMGRMSRAFNEWMRRYTDEPERFAREFQQCGEYLAQIAKGETPTYGDECAAYFTSILDGIDSIESPAPPPGVASSP